MLVADYTFFDFFWSMLVFFLWIMWFWLLFTIWTDIFRRHDIGGGGKALWLIFTIVLPFLGAFIYLITQNEHMTKRNVEAAQRQRAQFDDYVRETAGSGSGSGGGAAGEIERAKGLLDSGAISQAEFDAIKQKALA
jgi:Phospholipase_D-nuclease N-terminal/Short C-terminal domain